MNQRLQLDDCRASPGLPGVKLIHMARLFMGELISPHFIGRKNELTPIFTSVGMKATGEAEALHRLLKIGPRKNYWNEFVYLAYHHHHQADAIYLSGIPDLKATLPHA
jgi:hypothetical protein